MKKEAKRLAKEIKHQHKLWNSRHFILTTCKRTYDRFKEENVILVNKIGGNYNTLIPLVVSELGQMGIVAKNSSAYCEHSIDIA